MSDNDKIKLFYQHSYGEDGRMERNKLEFIRSKEIISRYLTKAPMEIADIGGATGVYSYWLAGQGHNVHLLDFTPSHIEQAKEYGERNNISLASYNCADARHLPYEDACFDIALMMGPLYHLQEKNDRLQCLSEAKRVLKPDGVLMCALISRYASLMDGFGEMLIDDERFIKILDTGLKTGLHSPPDGTPFFTSAFFHTPSDIESELKAAGFGSIDFIAVEGFARAVNADELLENEKHSELFLEYLRRTERVPELMGISDHFFAITRKSR